MPEVDNSQPEDTFKILVASDVHLGYAEKNAIRGQDSFVSFEEILQLASKNKVDFLLLGGDLFHESRPSPYCINKCLELLRKYCLGDHPVQIEFLSDQSYHFQYQRNPIVNYEDPNLNVAIPVFSIHGNHDDPTGNKQISVLDVLASSGLINYFGRFNDYNKLDIKPILLQKGKSKLAMYGLSHIKDERLGRLFREKKVIMRRPQGDDWFNILVLHQNRAQNRGVKNYIPETAIPSFIDLVIWGHEHDCRIEPEAIERGIYISQPGSSVATSLAVGESIKKHVGLLRVHMGGFQMIPIPLKTVRPFVIEEFFLENPKSDNYLLEKPSDQAVDMVKEKIDQMVSEANAQHKDKSKPPLPLIRLKVFYHDDRQIFNPIRIGMQFMGCVANPDDMIKLASTIAKERRAKSNLELDEDELRQFEDVNTWATCVEDIIVKYLNTDEGRKGMTVLSVKGLVESVSRFVKYDDADVLGNLVEKQMKQTVGMLVEMDPECDKILNAIEALRDQRQRETGENGDQNNDFNKIDDVLGTSNANKTKSTINKDDDIQEISSDDDQPSTSTAAKKKATPSKGRGSRGGVKTRGARGKRGGKNNTNYPTMDDFFD